MDRWWLGTQNCISFQFYSNTRNFHRKQSRESHPCCIFLPSQNCSCNKVKKTKGCLLDFWCFKLGSSTEHENHQCMPNSFNFLWNLKVKLSYRTDLNLISRPQVPKIGRNNPRTTELTIDIEHEKLQKTSRENGIQWRWLKHESRRRCEQDSGNLCKTPHFSVWLLRKMLESKWKP